MEEKEIKAIELEVESLVQFRNNCIAFIGLLVGGVSGLILSEFSYLKLVFILSGLFVLYFLFTLVNTVDKDIDRKIKDIKK